MNPTPTDPAATPRSPGRTRPVAADLSYANSHGDGLPIRAVGHNEETFAFAPARPQFAERSLFLRVIVAPPVRSFVLDHQNSAVAFLAEVAKFVSDSFGCVPLPSRRIPPTRGHASLTDGDQGFEEFGDVGFVGSAELARDVGGCGGFGMRGEGVADGADTFGEGGGPFGFGGWLRF